MTHRHVPRYQDETYLLDDMILYHSLQSLKMRNQLNNVWCWWRQDLVTEYDMNTFRMAHTNMKGVFKDEEGEIISQEVFTNNPEFVEKYEEVKSRYSRVCAKKDLMLKANLK